MLLNWPQLEDRFKSDFGSSFVLHSAEPVSGGDINLGFQLDTNHGPYFIKLNTPDKLEMFESEREGLLELAKCLAFVV
ncbi:MAG: fructosamine kinase family protein, partial [Pseudomonadales bacterium]